MRNAQLKHSLDRSDFKTSDDVSGALSNPRDAVIGIGRDQTIVFFSDSAASIFGFDKKEIVGRPADILLPEPELCGYHASPPDSARSAGQSLACSGHRTTKGRRRDGTVFPAEVSLAKGCWRDEPVVFAVIREISDQARVRPGRHAALQASERRYRAIMEASPEPILITDVESGRIAEANRAAVALFGRPRSELIGLHFSNLHSENTRAKRCTTFREHIDVGRIVVPDAVMLTSGGRELPVEIYAAPVEIDGRSHLIGFFRDMSQRTEHAKRLEQALNEANAAVEAKRMFLANVTHELKTPLNAIIGFADLLGREIHGPHAHPSFQEYADIIQQSGQHLLSLVNDLLDLSSLELGKLALAKEPIEAAPVVEQCRGIMGKMLSDGEVHLVIDIAPEFSLLADRRALKQMLLNLLSNALKYSGPQREIHVIANVNRDGESVISVIDRGAGIEPERLARIAEPFAAGADHGARQKGGTGIGLSITKGLIERHGGRFEIDSAPGHGTVARLVFPSERQTDTPAARQAA